MAKEDKKKLYNNLVLHHPIIIDCNITMFFSLTFFLFMGKREGDRKWEVESGTIKIQLTLIVKMKDSHTIYTRL